MKKYFLLGLMIAIAPNICFGAGARYTQLVREKQRKMEELEKCMGATNGLKIAGLSTIGLTAVGVAGNVAQAKKLDEYESGIESKQKELEKVNKDIATTQKEIDEKKAEEEISGVEDTTAPQEIKYLPDGTLYMDTKLQLPDGVFADKINFKPVKTSGFKVLDQESLKKEQVNQLFKNEKK